MIYFYNGNQTFDNQLKFNIVKNYCLYTFLTLFWKWNTKEKLYLLEINFNGTTKHKNILNSFYTWYNFTFSLLKIKQNQLNI